MNYRIFGFYSFFGNYTLIVSDPDVAKQIMTRDFDHFVNRDKVDPNKVDKLLGKSVLMLRDEKWREMRSTLSPVYTSSKLKHMYGLLQECIDEFISAYEKKALGNNNRVVVDTHDAFARVTADGIVTTALGFKGDCTTNKESEIFKVAEDMETDFTSPRVLIFLNLFPGLCKFLGIELFRKSIHEFFETNVLGEVKRRQQLNVHRPDVIDLLIQAKNGKLDSEAGDEVEEKVIRKKIEASKWTDEDLVAQALVFFLGGFESTATLIQSIFWELAKNPDVQQTLIEEVDEVLESLNGKPISYEQLNNMKYLEMVVNETLRKWPSFRVTSRLCSKDYVVETNDGKKYAIKKGIELFIAIGSIQMDPKYFKDPETFDPTRFDEENKKNIQSGTFIPFGIVSCDFVYSLVVFYIFISGPTNVHWKSIFSLKSQDDAFFGGCQVQGRSMRRNSREIDFLKWTKWLQRKDLC